jgi:AAA15 family ATPase/GTPase
LVAKKLMAAHTDVNGKDVVFEMNRESDGSLRAIDLLPAFIDLLSSKKKVYVIDELDRSLHSRLTRSLLEEYLKSCSITSRSQLLFTTHDLSLMDQDLFRRDEMWVVERGDDGASELIAFSDYKEIRYDKDIRKSYLQGRLGGVPRISLAGSSGDPVRLKEG